MEIRKLLTDDDAVSPVIGVILMVAITVILAAVIGAFVLGFGGGGPSAPSATWDTSTNGSGTFFNHSGGDTIQDAGDVLTTSAGTTLYSNETVMSTGDWVHGDQTSGEVTLIWESPEGDSTQELATHNA